MSEEFSANINVEIKLNEFKKKVADSVKGDKILSLVTYTMTDYGEQCTKIILDSILSKFERLDLFDICYSAAKELIINATKSNLKRVLFEEMNLNIEKEEDYEKGMEHFKAVLDESHIKNYNDKFQKKNLPVTVTFYYNKYVLNIKVKNNFTLQPVEEERIRKKFSKSESFSSILDFYMEYGDDSEGAGMGLTMVGILLDNSGISRHGFALYSSEKYNETCAKLEIPLSKDYITKRQKFDMLIKERNISPGDLRKEFHYKYRDFPYNIDK